MIHKLKTIKEVYGYLILDAVISEDFTYLISDVFLIDCHLCLLLLCYDLLEILVHDLLCLLISLLFHGL